jgi:hypothetical protein
MAAGKKHRGDHLRIGVIADTHGLLREEAAAALAGCDRILHAGDVGAPAVLDALRAIAPVHAIAGNVDRGAWADALPQRLVLALGGVRIRMLHDRKALAPGEAADVDVVVSGHSHQPRLETVDGVLYLNPGSAGPRRFRLPVSVGYLHIAHGTVRGELRELL